MAKSFKDLIVWQKSIILAKGIYGVCAGLPKTEQYGIMSQMQRCAVSIPSNIAEGSKRGTQKDFRQFIAIAKGSAAELETQLILAEELYEISVQDLLKLLVEV